MLLVLQTAITCRCCVFSVSFFSPYQQKDFTRICCVAYNVAVKFPCYKDANHGFVLMEGNKKKTSSKIVALSFFFIVYNQYDQHIPLLLK